MLLLFIIVPVGILTMLKGLEILLGSTLVTVSETITLEPIKWEIERPSWIIDINETIQGTYADENVFMNSSILVDDFHDSGPYGSPYIALIMNVTAIFQGGFACNLNFTFSENYQYSEVWVPNPERDSAFYRPLKNLSIVDWAQAFDKWWLLKGDVKAFIKTVGINNPSWVYFWGPAHWILRSSENRTFQLKLEVELLYFNGTAYKKVVQPYHLKIGPDDNNDFETADEIPSEASMFYIGGYDKDDYYKTYIEQECNISVIVTNAKVLMPLVEIYIYDPARNNKTDTTRRDEPSFRGVNFITDVTGYWYIRLHAPLETYGFYLLTIKISPKEGT
jgi:hypothetical protein